MFYNAFYLPSFIFYPIGIALFFDAIKSKLYMRYNQGIEFKCSKFCTDSDCLIFRYASLMGSPIAGSNTTSSSDRWLTDASWLTLQNINLGYTLPTKLVKTLYLNKVRVYAAGDNLFYWSKRKGFDPRSYFDGTPSGLSYSPVRSISGGINVQF